MHDFGNLVYLDLHKTGSTFISKFLEQCTKSKALKFEKHGWIKNDYRSDAYYFISIRNPIDLYSSLYRYGLDKKGGAYTLLCKAGFSHVYNDFDSFVSFCLDECNAPYLGFGYNEKISGQLGLMSFRYMKLSLQFPMKKIKSCIKSDKHLSALESQFITSFILKNECMIEGLRTVVSNNPEIFDLKKVDDYLSQNERVNTSRLSREKLSQLSSETTEKLRLKEQLLFKYY